MARWFGPKRIGFGVSPRSWQGWLASAIFVVVLVAVRLIKPESFGYPHWTRPAAITAVIVAFLGLVYLKYERDERGPI
jgi:hypothetical protein